MSESMHSYEIAESLKMLHCNSCSACNLHHISIQPLYTDGSLSRDTVHLHILPVHVLGDHHGALLRQLLDLEVNDPLPVCTLEGS